MKEEWLFRGAYVPVDAETTAALVAEIKRLIHVVGGMALAVRREWVGLTEEEATALWESTDDRDSWELIKQVEKTIKEKNT